jgi:hypothetical protein
VAWRERKFHESMPSRTGELYKRDSLNKNGREEFLYKRNRKDNKKK